MYYVPLFCFLSIHNFPTIVNLTICIWLCLNASSSRCVQLRTEKKSAGKVFQDLRHQEIKIGKSGNPNRQDVSSRISSNRKPSLLEPSQKPKWWPRTRKIHDKTPTSFGKSTSRNNEWRKTGFTKNSAILFVLSNFVWHLSDFCWKWVYGLWTLFTKPGVLYCRIFGEHSGHDLDSMSDFGFRWP